MSLRILPRDFFHPCSVQVRPLLASDHSSSLAKLALSCLVWCDWFYSNPYKVFSSTFKGPSISKLVYEHEVFSGSVVPPSLSLLFRIAPLALVALGWLSLTTVAIGYGLAFTGKLAFRYGVLPSHWPNFFEGQIEIPSSTTPPAPQPVLSFQSMPAFSPSKTEPSAYTQRATNFVLVNQDDIIFTLKHDSESLHFELQAIRTTGERLWTSGLQEGSPATMQVTLDSLYLICPGKAFCISLSNGTTNWKASLPCVIALSTLVSNGKIYVPSLVYPSPQLITFDAASGTQESACALSSSSIAYYKGNSLLTIDDSGTYIIDKQKTLYILKSAERVSSTELSKELDYFAPVIGKDGTIYIASPDGELRFYVYEQEQLTLQHTFYASEGFQHPPVMGPDGTIYLETKDQFLVALNQAGALKWYSYLDRESHFPISVSPEGLLFADKNNQVLAINPANGRVTASADLPDLTTSPFAFKERSLYVQTYRGLCGLSYR